MRLDDVSKVDLFIYCSRDIVGRTKVKRKKAWPVNTRGLHPSYNYSYFIFKYCKHTKSDERTNLLMRRCYDVSAVREFPSGSLAGWYWSRVPRLLFWTGIQTDYSCQLSSVYLFQCSAGENLNISMGDIGVVVWRGRISGMPCEECTSGYPLRIPLLHRF